MFDQKKLNKLKQNFACFALIYCEAETLDEYNHKRDMRKIYQNIQYILNLLVIYLIHI